MSETALSYFFSALSQSTAALFAVVGMFAVYRLQIQDNSIQEVFRKAINKVDIIERYYDNPSRSTAVTAIIKRKDIVARMELIKTKIEQRKEANAEHLLIVNKNSVAQIMDCLKEITEEYTILERIKTKMGLPLRLIAEIFCLALVCLPMVDILAYDKIIPILIIVFISATIFAVKQTVAYISFTTRFINE
ncbi:MAG: hypothetical protein GY858_08965 [Candidatus Omnitrophica bacterium]|nr:hypothetical protein [Candidatus Omnitrophota bacterium]